MSDGPPRSESKARDPEHRNRRIAQAGLASAAAAGIWERVRSKSRGKNGKSRSRSKSRIRTGVPIAAAGLGGAALAGLYEKTQAGKAAKKQAIIDEEVGRGRPSSRSRSRSRSVPAPYPEHGRRRGVDQDPMIAYGGEPIYPERGGRGYHSDEEPGMYRRRHRASSAGSSPDTRRGSRSRSKSKRRLAEAGLAAGAVGAAGYAYNKNRERKRNASESRERREYRPSYPYHITDTDPIAGRDDEYSEPYTPDEYGRDYTPPPHGTVGYDQPQAPYPGGTYFPPPPVDQAYHSADPYAPAQEGAYNPYPQYNPADYPPESSHAPYEQTRGAYGDSSATLGAPYPNDTFAGDARYPEPGNEPKTRGRDDSRGRSQSRSRSRNRRGRDPENVSGNNPPFGAAPSLEQSGYVQPTVRNESDDAGMSVHE